VTWPGVTEVRRALVSLSDKAGLLPFAEALASLGAAIVSTGSTAEVIRAAGIEVENVADVTGFPEALDGRVKTLHPAIHAGILADRRNPAHVEELQRLGFEPFDLVVVNLYPFRETVASGAAFDDVIEQIDIGGPTLVRAAAKNLESVAVVVSPDRYDDVVAELRHEGGLTRSTRLALAAEAFDHVAGYDVAIAEWFRMEAGSADELPGGVFVALEKADVLQGKEMSFNNWLDAESALGVARSLAAPAAVVVKHNNPCGAAVAATLEEAYRAAVACDPTSAFGGVVACNVPVDAATAGAIAEIFTEAVVAPGFDDDALATLGGKQNLRVVRVGEAVAEPFEVRAIAGGALVQEPDAVVERREEMTVASTRQPTEGEWRDLLFAWTVAARVKSNAIVFAANGATVGVGAGQMSRVDSVDIAARKAGDRAKGAVMASDAFFPFRDGVDRAAEAGIAAVIQPGGSVNDAEVLAACEEHGMAVVLTGRRHFRH
jgi:phosphoribosylaminoimidazolecarboxamide formyltransferase/IMP cyclohydrolase